MTACLIHPYRYSTGTPVPKSKPVHEPNQTWQSSGIARTAAVQVHSVSLTVIALHSRTNQDVPLDGTVHRPSRLFEKAQMNKALAHISCLMYNADGLKHDIKYNNVGMWDSREDSVMSLRN